MTHSRVTTETALFCITPTSKYEKVNHVVFSFFRIIIALKVSYSYDVVYVYILDVAIYTKTHAYHNYTFIKHQHYV